MINLLGKAIRKENLFYMNSVFLMLASISSAGLGFIFWMFAAKLYSKEDVGLAIALVSSLSLIILLTRFGIDQSLLRFFPEGKRHDMISTSIIITTIASLIFGIVFILGIEFFSPQLLIVKNHALIYLLILATNSLVSMTGTSFIALRRTDYSFLQNILIGSRIFFLPSLVILGAFGIFSSIGLSFIIALIFSVFFLSRLGIKHFDTNIGFIKESSRFSIDNYISGLLITAPNLVLPIMVLNLLGPSSTAQYYIVFSISSLLFMIPSAFCTSLFVEGSYGEVLKENAIKAIIAIFSMLLPATIIIYLFGKYLLGQISESYIEGYSLLKTLSISSFLVGIWGIFFSIKRVQKETRGLLFLSAINFGLLIGLSYIFILKFGIDGVGYAWVIGYGLCCLAIAGMLWKERMELKIRY